MACAGGGGFFCKHLCLSGLRHVSDILVRVLLCEIIDSELKPLICNDMNLISNKFKVKYEIETLVLHTMDSVEGYEKAADCIEEADPQIAAEWRAVAASRGGHVDRLNQRLACIGEAGRERGSLEGAVHRGLISVKDMFASNSLNTVINEAVRGEEKLLQYIEEAFSDLEVVDGAPNRVICDLKAHVEGSLDMLRRHRKH